MPQTFGKVETHAQSSCDTFSMLPLEWVRVLVMLGYILLAIVNLQLIKLVI